MLFQEGLDVGDVLFPLLFLVGLCLLGLIIWLVIILTRNKKDQDVPPVKQQLPDTQGRLPQYILAIGKMGTQYEIYVKGVRVSADTVFDRTTRKEALEALRVLARYARARLSVADEPAQAASEPTSAAPYAQPKAQIDITNVPDTQPRVIEPVTNPPIPSVGAGMNLVQEISDILDEMKANTPTLHDHAVDLISAQEEGIHFVVDGSVYKEVDDIPNAEIRDLIKRATEEWGRR